MGMTEHHSPSLGSDLVAEADAGLAFFRGVPYASVSQRWTQSRIQDSLPSKFNATKFGPQCLQPPHISIVPFPLEAPAIENDEFKCLNLNITAPLEALPEKGEGKTSNLLPVMVWVHGGAFKNGTNSDPRHEPHAFFSIAKEAGQPVVLVQINYRLGVFGWAPSSDMASEHALQISDSSQSQPQYFANFGLLDQRNAFQWVQNHIQDFGGDPEKVTAFGVSAGSGSLHFHIQSGKPLFDRAILMSGCAPVMGPSPIALFEGGWKKLYNKAELSEEPSEKRLAKLRSLTAEELLSLSSSLSLSSLADGELLPKAWKIGDSHPESRCKEIIIGTTNIEAIIFDSLIPHIPQAYVHQKVIAAFANPNDAAAFCSHFGLVLEQSPEAFRDAIRFILSVIIFQFPSLRLAETYEGKTFMYHFEVPSPYEGPSFGLSVHGQCATLLHNNDSKAWPESTQKVAREMANLWTSFAYGEEPWATYLTSRQFMRLGPGECSMKNFENDDKRDYGYIEWLRGHYHETLGLLRSLTP